MTLTKQVHNDNLALRLFYIVLMITVFIFIVYYISITPAHAETEKIGVKYTWDDSMDDGILTYYVDSDDYLYEKIVDGVILDWQHTMKSIISFKKIFNEYDANIVFKIIEGQDEISQNTAIEDDEEWDTGGKTFIQYSYHSGKNVMSHAEVNLWEGMLKPEILAEYGMGKWGPSNIVKHEIGHALGLWHSDRDNALMNGKKDHKLHEQNLEVSECEAYTALDQNGMIYSVSEDDFATSAEFHSEGGYYNTVGYYECIDEDSDESEVEYNDDNNGDDKIKGLSDYDIDVLCDASEDYEAHKKLCDLLYDLKEEREDEDDD